MIYVVMHFNEIFEGIYYTDEENADKRVTYLNKATESGDFWYKQLIKYE